MRQYFLGVSLAVLVGLTLLACGSSTNFNSMPGSPGASTVPVSISIHDTPPPGVTILRFEVLITAATLQPANASQSPVNMLLQPQDVELIHLQSESALLANLNVPTGMYTGLSATFANPEMTILNQSNQTYTVGAQMCGPQEICRVVPTLNQMSISVSSAPFPINLTASSPVILDLHFDVNASVQNDLSVTPMVSVNQIPVPPNVPAQHMHIIGVVTGVTSPTFTLQSGFDGSTSTITTDSNTMYHFDHSCPMDNFSCIMVGQLLRVKVNVMSDGTLEATDVRLIQEQGLPAILGTIIAVNAAQSQFQLAVNFDEMPGANAQANDQPSQQFGDALSITVQLSGTTAFSVDSDNLTVPAGLTFLGPQDLVVGQTVEFQPILSSIKISGTPPNVTVTVGASSVQLEPSQITANVSTVNAQATPPNFVLNMLPALFTGANITQIQVDTVSGTDFDGINGVGALSAGQTVSVAGLLFNNSANPAQPTAVAVEVKLRNDNDQ